MHYTQTQNYVDIRDSSQKIRLMKKKFFFAKLNCVCICEYVVKLRISELFIVLIHSDWLQWFVSVLQRPGELGFVTSYSLSIIAFCLRLFSYCINSCKSINQIGDIATLLLYFLLHNYFLWNLECIKILSQECKKDFLMHPSLSSFDLSFRLVLNGEQ